MGFVIGGSDVSRSLVVQKRSHTMTRTTLTPRRRKPAVARPGPEPEEEALESTGDDSEELAEETGIDLSDASELDADHVPFDEESDRVLQAPD